MKDIKDQISLLKKVRVRRNKYETKEDTARHRNHILEFIKKHRFLILVLSFYLLLRELWKHPWFLLVKINYHLVLKV